MRGFTLLELLLVVGIAAVLIVAGVTTYNLVSNSQKINETIRLIHIIIEDTHKMYAISPDYGTANIEAMLYGTGSVPSRYLSPDDVGHMVTPFAGDIDALNIIGSGSSIAPPNDFEIKLRVPPALIPQIALEFDPRLGEVGSVVVYCDEVVQIWEGTASTYFNPGYLAGICGGSMAVPSTYNLALYVT